jgi:alpha-mannosidase
MDQGERCYRFMFLAGSSDEILTRVDREAAMFNQRAYALAFCPSGAGSVPAALATIDMPNVSLSCFKRSERCSDTYILRVFEAQGKAVTARVEIPVLNTGCDVVLKPFEIKTFKVRCGQVEETDMLEENPMEIQPENVEFGSFEIKTFLLHLK